ncbi:MAG: ABC transporter ATP-binding protein [Desulfomicrobium sp.]|nr:ABC transporter ATP-binding protein [Pseudomonadota bacterium]MBV1711748.1 ABC transporter ATP-binding protein [Desulfomicrobium sp.]MBU4572664.1 ABC transporter ATP-binding protein [Pseudomonadota bacterium]MBU4593555.1 ABC transporter ATP-binding protein [Pseudomonadota bacterium]MBV1720477.1 ABC transporter ATP-binding protein [Desulfomicrobium sp.]
MALLEITNLTQRFGGLLAVNDLSVHLEGRELCALIGPNGAGKTTVFNLVSGFYQPSDGSIKIGGVDTRGMKPHQVTALGVARTFQNIRLWNDMTVLDNIKVSQHYRLGYSLMDSLMRTRRYIDREAAIDRTAMELLEFLGMRELANEFPPNLAYGTQRKVEIARALSIKPKLLLLDEPAAGLPSSDVVELIKLIEWIHKEFDLAIWMIEHQMTVVMSLCQWIKVIDFGATIAEGTPEDIRNNPVVIRAYLGDENI